MTGQTEQLGVGISAEAPLRWIVHRFVDGYFTADARAVQSLLPAQLRPVRWSPHRTVLSVICGDWEWWAGRVPIGRSGTMMVSALVSRGPRKGPVAMVRDMKVGGPSDTFRGGAFVLEMATTNPEVRRIFSGLFGVPGSIVDLHYEQRPTSDQFIFRRSGELLAELTVNSMGRASRFGSSRDRGFCVRGGRLLGFYGEGQGTSRSRFGLKSAELRLGDPPHSATLRDLQISSQAFASSIWLEGTHTIIPADRDFGPATCASVSEQGEPSDGRLATTCASTARVDIDQRVSAEQVH